MESRALDAIRWLHVEHLHMPVGKIDPIEHRPSVENEHVEFVSVGRCRGEFAQRIRAFLKFEELPPEPLPSVFRQSVELLDDRPGQQESVVLTQPEFQRRACA